MPRPRMSSVSILTHCIRFYVVPALLNYRLVPCPDVPSSYYDAVYIRVKSRENSFLRTPEQLTHKFRASEKAQKLGVLRAYLKREAESGRLKAAVSFRACHCL